MNKMYRIVRRDEGETDFHPITDEIFTEQEIKNAFALMMRSAIVVNENHQGNPVFMISLHSDEVDSIPDLKMFVSVEEVM